MIGKKYCLVLIRHGHSDWNLTNRFTGWADIALTEMGVNEAIIAGETLAESGYQFDEAHISVLQRTRQTAETLLKVANNSGIPICENWRLNERHYGQLQGLNKQEIFREWGTEKSHRWWRGFHEPPPALTFDDPRHPRFDPRYSQLDLALLPCSESLFDCQKRLLPYWDNVLVPRIKNSRRLLVVSHGNTLRSLLMYLQQLTPDEIEKVEVPSGVPLVCHFNEDMELIDMTWLGEL